VFIPLIAHSNWIAQLVFVEVNVKRQGPGSFGQQTPQRGGIHQGAAEDARRLGRLAAPALGEVQGRAAHAPLPVPGGQGPEPQATGQPLDESVEKLPVAAAVERLEADPGTGGQAFLSRAPNLQ